MYKRISVERAKELFYGARSGELYLPDCTVYPFDARLSIASIRELKYSDSRVTNIVAYRTGIDFEHAVSLYKRNHMLGGLCYDKEVLNNLKVRFYTWVEDFNKLDKLKVDVSTKIAGYSLSEFASDPYNNYSDPDFMSGTDNYVGFSEELCCIYNTIKAFMAKKDQVIVHKLSVWGEKKYACRVSDILSKERLSILYNAFNIIGYNGLIKRDKCIYDFCSSYLS